MKFVDRFSMAVLDLLSSNSSITVTAISRKMGVSRQAIYKRIYKMRGEQ